MAVYISGDAGDIFSALTCVTQKTNIYIYIYIYIYKVIFILCLPYVIQLTVLGLLRHFGSPEMTVQSNVDYSATPAWIAPLYVT